MIHRFHSLLETTPSRINVVGTSGSGKTTFSRGLAEILGYPYIEMDRLFWKPNWTQPTDDEFFPKVKEALAQEKWVLDGNYNRTRPIKWENVELVVWLDYSFTFTLYRAVRRALNRSWTKSELWPGTGNRESFKKSFFSKDSIVLWTINTHGKVRERYELELENSNDRTFKVLRLRNHREAEAFLDYLQSKLMCGV